MGSKYKEYPRLDRTQLRDGYRRCVENAGRVTSDAMLLKEAGRFRSAYLVLHAAVNELGNAMRLFEAGRSGVQNWEEWWDAILAHHGEGNLLENREAGESPKKFDRVRQELIYVGFDRKDEVFLMPREDGDSELRELFDKEAAYVESMLLALPSYGFELLEFREMVQHSPGLALPVLYARIEEIMGEESAMDETDLLFAVAADMGMSPHDVTAGFGQWKRATPNARAYLDQLLRVQGTRKRKEEKKEVEPRVGVYMDLLRRVQGKLKPR